MLPTQVVRRARGCLTLMFAVSILGLTNLLTSPTLGGTREASASPDQQQRIRDQYGRLPLSFIQNHGQVPEPIAWYVQRPGLSLGFTPQGQQIILRQGQGESARTQRLEVELVEAETRAIETLIPAEGIVSYFKGPKEQWKTGLPTAEAIVYREVWPGIDVQYRGSGGRLESFYLVAPGADPGQIRLRYRGQDSLALADDGDLVIGLSGGAIRETAPVLYQEIGGDRVTVAGRYRLWQEGEVGFEVAAYDRSQPLVIDPVLVYAGYTGGTGGQAVGIAVDTAGNAYVVGSTPATEASFTVTQGPDLSYNGGSTDVFVAKVNAAGTALVYAGYIGGTGSEFGNAIALDSAGNAYVTGQTDSTQTSFPVTVGPGLSYNGGATDAFVAKVNATGTALDYAGYLGGSGLDSGNGIAVDSSDNAYVTGNTGSTQTSFPILGGPDLSYNGGTSDAFVAKVNAAGTALVYAGYIGGSGSDQGQGIALDGAGNAYVTGSTGSTQSSFPVSIGPDLTHNGGNDAFVAKVNAAGTGLIYAGYIGGTDTDTGIGIAVDGAGNAYVTGETKSSAASFPVTVGPDLTFNGGSNDVFVAKVNPAGTALVYAGYIGGSSGDGGRGIAVDSAGNAYVIGFTASTQVSFPVSLGPDLTYNGGASDAFVAKVKADGTGLFFASYIGGSGADQGRGIALDTAGNAYVCGDTSSSEASFPVTVGPALTLSGGGNAFVAKLGLVADLSITKTDGVTTAVPGESLTYNIIATNAGPDAVSGVSVTDNFPTDLSCTWTCLGASGGICTPGPVAGNIDDAVNLPSGATLTYTVTCSIDPAATGTLSNSVSISSAVTDSVPGNESATDSDTLTPQTDVTITKTDGVTTATPGTWVTYTMVASNAGPSDAPLVTINDSVPAACTQVLISCVNQSGGGNCIDAGPPVTASLPAGATVTATLDCLLAADVTGTLSNTASISATTTDPNADNNSANDSDTLTPQADVSITKTDGVTSVTPGGSVTYSIVAGNAGPSTATGVTVSDTFPASFSGCSTTAVGSGGASGFDPGPTAGHLNDTGISLPPGASVTYTATCTLVAGLPGGTQIDNSAGISSAVTDPTPDNNAASDTTTVVAALLSATKTLTPGSLGFVPGAALSYSIVITNEGNATQADNPGNEFTDVLPPSLTLVSASATSGTTTANPLTNTVTWNGAIPAGGSVTITIQALIKLVATGTVSNQGTLSYDGDNNGSNEATALTDDPSLPRGPQATSFEVTRVPPATPFNSPTPIPTLSAWAAFLLVGLLGLLGWQRMRGYRF